MGEQHVLVVDDSKSARFAMRKFLEQLGYQVDTAEGAQAAYAYLRTARPQVIFLDHVMPGVDGFDVLKKLKGDPKLTAIPVVICSSNEGREFIKNAKEQGAAEVLPKPPDPQQIRKVLKRLNQEGADAGPSVSPSVSGRIAPTPTSKPPATSAPPQEPARTPVRQASTLSGTARSAADPSPTAPTPSSAMHSAQTPPSSVGSGIQAPRHTIDSNVEQLRSEFIARSKAVDHRLNAIERQLEQLKDGIGVTSSLPNTEMDAGTQAQLSDMIDERLQQLRDDLEEVLDAHSRQIDKFSEAIERVVRKEAAAAARQVAQQELARLVEQLRGALASAAASTLSDSSAATPRADD